MPIDARLGRFSPLEPEVSVFGDGASCELDAKFFLAGSEFLWVCEKTNLNRFVARCTVARIAANSDEALDVEHVTNRYPAAVKLTADLPGKVDVMTIANVWSRGARILPADSPLHPFGRRRPNWRRVLGVDGEIEK